jgi:hypothetical protein
MPSGYENSPDYGGPDPSWRGALIPLIAVLTLLAWLALG